MNLSITEIVKKGRFAETNQEASALLNKSPWLAESQNFPAATARTFAVFCVFYVMSQLWLSNEMFLCPRLLFVRFFLCLRTSFITRVLK